MPELHNKSIDLIFADLPYGTTDCKWDIPLPMDELWTQFKRIIKPNGAIVLFAQQPFATDLINAARDLFRYEIVWEKPNAQGFLNANKMPLRAHELLLVFYSKLPVYNPQFTKGEPYLKTKGNPFLAVYGTHKRRGNCSNNGFRYPRDVICFKQKEPKESFFHRTQKPLALCRWVINTYTNPGDIVFDPTCGSGSIPVAAKQTERMYIGIDIVKEHTDIAEERLSKTVDQTKLCL